MRLYLSNQILKPTNVLALLTDEKNWAFLKKKKIVLANIHTALALIPSRVRKPKTSLKGITLCLH